MKLVSKKLFINTNSFTAKKILFKDNIQNMSSLIFIYVQYRELISYCIPTEKPTFIYEKYFFTQQKVKG